MARVYLETSFFSACVSARTSPKSVGWRETSNEWWRTQAPRHELYVSDEVVDELSDPEFVQGPAALAMRAHFATLCMRLGLIPPQIVTPDLLVETDE